MGKAFLLLIQAVTEDCVKFKFIDKCENCEETMESFHITDFNIPSCQESYDFNSEDLADIPCPDDNSTQETTSSPENVELPLPPGTSGDDFPIPLPPKQDSLFIFNNFSPSLPLNKAVNDPSNLNHVLEPENFNILPLDENDQQNIQSKSLSFLDDAKYSPSKVDSDEENQDFITIKPKVLGKEQAKKRLMAFSLTKQSNVAAKKQNKAFAPAKNKEKPPHPNKSSNVQDQFRATISAIEEEKKKMFQNMPSYLLIEMSELAKSLHTNMSSSTQLLEKLKNESVELKKRNSGKDRASSVEGVKSKRNVIRSRSRSSNRGKSKKQRRSRSKKRSRSKRSRSRSRRRSHSKSHRSTSRSRKDREDKTKKEKVLQEFTLKKSCKDWDEFKASGVSLEKEFEIMKNRIDESNYRRSDYTRKSKSPGDHPDFKPVFDYLNVSCGEMKFLQAKPSDSSHASPVLFPERIIKYTFTKPMLCWAENPNHATDYYMSKQMLLENCDPSASSVLNFIIDNEHVLPEEEENISVTESIKSRPWYSQKNYLTPKGFNTEDGLKSNKTLFKTRNVLQEENQVKVLESGSETVSKDDSSRGESLTEKRISLVNDSYMSEEEDLAKEVSDEDLNVHIHSDVKNVKVRSRWDSDNDAENSEKEISKKKSNSEKPSDTEHEESLVKRKGKLIDDFDVAPCEPELLDSKESKNLSRHPVLVHHSESPNLNAADNTAGNLVSEYEEFLKMVSVDSNDDPGIQKKRTPTESKLKSEKSKMKKLEKSSEENRKIQSPKSRMTDWDQESDHELKLNIKKMVFAGSLDEFLIPGKDEPSDAMFEEKKQKSSKKKARKPKSKKSKLLKKGIKGKKSKHDSSLSQNSTSDSYDSDSDSNSKEKSVSPKRSKKKKKVSKTKKKTRDDFSRSDSESDESKTKNKFKKKKSEKVKKSSVDDSDEADTALLKQLDFKKQLIMKRIEEIDSISDRSIRKKEKENRRKKKVKESSEESDSEKKKKIEDRFIKKKSKSAKKSRSSEKTKKAKRSRSFSESSDEGEKKIKSKKTEKRKQDYSESSGSEEKRKVKSKSSYKKTKKTKSSKKSSSSLESDDSDNSSKNREKRKKKKSNMKSGDEKSDKGANSGFKENLISELDSQNERRSTYEDKTTRENSEKKKKDDNWETSSSDEESEQESKTKAKSWSDEVTQTARESKVHASEDSLSKGNFKNVEVLPKKNLSENNSTGTSEANNQLGSETLKTSLSNFSFNENSFCSFGQELSRDFFLAERSCSNSGSENLRSTIIEPRPFQSVSKGSDAKKSNNSELYSPGYSDSEVSASEVSTCEKVNSHSNAKNVKKDDVYDPLNCDSDSSAENKTVELTNIPLPRGFDSNLDDKNLENISTSSTSSSEGNTVKDFSLGKTEKSASKDPLVTSPLKYSFTSGDFTPVVSKSPTADERSTPTKRQLMSVKGQQKLVSKAASVFQDESDEENFEPANKKSTTENDQDEYSVTKKEKILIDSKNVDRHFYLEQKHEVKKRKKENRSASREKSIEREKVERKRSRSKEKRSSSKSSKKGSSPKLKRKSRTPELKREKREIRSDSFEIEPLKSSVDSSELDSRVQHIPVLTGLEPSSSDSLWNRSLVSGREFQRTTDTIVGNAESFDIYPSEESKFRNRHYDKDFEYYDRFLVEKSKDGKGKREQRRSRSRSSSPKKKRKSKSPERKRSPASRSPRRKSPSPRRWDSSPFSPRRSPKRKTPPRKYKVSRSPDKKRRSHSRSPKRRRSSPSKRSRSVSPRRYRSPRHRAESPKKKNFIGRILKLNDRYSPAPLSEACQAYISGLQNRIPVIGTSSEDVDMNLSPSTARSHHMDFPVDSSVAESEMYHSFYEGEYSEEYGMSGYSEEVGLNNLITVKNHDIEKVNSPERLSLDQRIELELNIARLGPQVQSDQYQLPTPVGPPFQELAPNSFPNSYSCESTNIISESYYQSPSVQMNPDFNGQYFNGHQQPQPPPQNYASFPQYSNTQPVQNSVLQVGNIVEVVPSLQHPPPPPPPLPPKTPQIMQVGNVLQVVPSQKVTPPVPSPVPHNYGLPDASPIMKTQKATAVVAPSSVVPTPNPEVVLNPLIKAIQLEREKKRKEKEKRKAEREARRKARQLRREAKLMSVNEKLKKSVENEGLMLGQEVEDDELLEGLDVPSPPIPVEIITVSSASALPPAGKGILITAGFMPKPPSEKKEVKFADGVCPGEGTSTSGEDIASPPPKPKLPKEKRFKKKKTKVKKKVKVQIIKQIIQEEDDDEDDLSPPPPPPGDPPPVFFARFPYAGDAQFPVYQTQTTTTTLTTVQYPAQTFE